MPFLVSEGGSNRYNLFKERKRHYGIGMENLHPPKEGGLSGDRRKHQPGAYKSTGKVSPDLLGLERIGETRTGSSGLDKSRIKIGCVKLRTRRKRRRVRLLLASEGSDPASCHDRGEKVERP